MNNGSFGPHRNIASPPPTELWFAARGLRTKRALRAKAEQGSSSLPREAQHDSPSAPRAQSRRIFIRVAPKTTRAILGEGSLCRLGYSRKSVLSDERGCGAKFLVAGIRVKRLVIALSNLGGRAGGIIKSGVQNVAAALGVPSQPGMRHPTGRSPLTDD